MSSSLVNMVSHPVINFCNVVGLSPHQKLATNVLNSVELMNKGHFEQWILVEDQVLVTCVYNLLYP